MSGLYFSNALDVTDQLTVTVGGRYNHATIQLEDKTGLFPDLNATNKYERFNPMAGANYKLLPGLSVYGGYSESNRAPTPAELGCAEPENPCLIESFLTDDPPLEQVVGRTGEAGCADRAATVRPLHLVGGAVPHARVRRHPAHHRRQSHLLRECRQYAAPGRRTVSDIRDAQVERVRELCLRRCHARQVHQSRDMANARSSNAGDRLPGIPQHRFKAGVEYWVTSKWKVGTDLVAASNSPFFPNESGQAERMTTLPATRAWT